MWDCQVKNRHVKHWNCSYHLCSARATQPHAILWCPGLSTLVCGPELVSHFLPLLRSRGFRAGRHLSKSSHLNRPLPILQSLWLEVQRVQWLCLRVLDTCSNSETTISCMQAEVGASVPGMEIGNGVPALWEDELGSKVDCGPHRC